MSAKNAIVILKTKSKQYPKFFEYRINHCGNINELYSNNFEHVKDYVKNNFTNVPVNYNKFIAIENSVKLAKSVIKRINKEQEIGYLEYGIIQYDNLERYYFDECV
jgi:hypothetical protein